MLTKKNSQIGGDDYVQNIPGAASIEKNKYKFTFSKDQSSIVCPLSDVFEPLRTVIQCVHSSHVGQQSLNNRDENASFGQFALFIYMWK